MTTTYHWNPRPLAWQDRRTGHMIVEGPFPGSRAIAYAAHWDADDTFSGYGFGASVREACDDLQANTEEWIKQGRPEI